MDNLIPTSLPLLSLLIWVPIFGGSLTLLFGDNPNRARWFALLVAPLFTGQKKRMVYLERLLR